MVFAPKKDVFEITFSDDDARIFTQGEEYEVIETTHFSDGTGYLTLQAGLRFDDGSGKAKLTAADQQTEVALSKSDLTGGKELPGCEMQLQDEAGEVMDTWISSQEPHILKGILTAGETYTLIEKKPASGYAYADSIQFEVSEDGSIDKVVMSDAPTQVEIQKIAEDTQTALSGARLQILDKTGTVCESWISSQDMYHLNGRLNAGETYVLHEEKAPIGYEVGEDMEFTVPEKAVVLSLQKVNTRRKPGYSSGGHSPKPEKKIGWITTAYHAGLNGSGSQEWDGSPNRYYKVILKNSLSKTGDPGLTRWYVLLVISFVLMLAGIFWQIKMTKEGRFAIIDFVRKRKKKKGRR
jgi:hypothetical protein